MPLLSFCIPTYNRVLSVVKLVECLLALRDLDIEVVVLDNGSTDGTFAELQKITDSRFILKTNGVNRGALYNMVTVFGHASGDYLIYSTDQDAIDVAAIKEFMLFLIENQSIKCGFCAFSNDPKVGNMIFVAGYNAINAVAYKGRHPSGYFFRNTSLKRLGLSENFSNYDEVDLFPLEFAFAELALTGDSAIFSSHTLFYPNKSDAIAKHKSATTVGTSKNAFFSPDSRLKMAIKYSCHVNKLDLDKYQAINIQAQIFVSGIVGATFGYRKIMKDKNLCHHYFMTPRVVGFYEMIFVAVKFAFKYFKSCPRIFGFYLFHFLTSVFIVLIRKVFNRVV